MSQLNLKEINLAVGELIEHQEKQQAAINKLLTSLQEYVDQLRVEYETANKK